MLTWQVFTGDAILTVLAYTVQGRHAYWVSLYRGDTLAVLIISYYRVRRCKHQIRPENTTEAGIGFSEGANVSVL